MADTNKTPVFPTTEQLKRELERRNFGKKYISTLMSTFEAILVAVAAIALISVFFLPVFRVSGESMSPLLKSHDVVLCGKSSEVSQGDIIAFYHNKKVLLKRVIAFSGDIVEINEKGRITVNGRLLAEDYIAEHSFGECDIEFPFTVPNNKYFVVGDNREYSVDSRSSSVGCVAQEDIIGRIYAVIWPIDRFSLIPSASGGGNNE